MCSRCNRIALLNAKKRREISREKSESILTMKASR